MSGIDRRSVRRQTELFCIVSSRSSCCCAIFLDFHHTSKIKEEQRIRKQLPQAINTTMDHIEAQLKKIRTKLDDVPAFQKAEVSVPFYLPRPFGHHDERRVRGQK